MIEIPAHGGLEPLLKAVAGGPAQFSCDLGRIDRVAPVVARAIAHAGDQAGVGGSLGPQPIHQSADRFHHIAIGALTGAAVITGTTHAIALAQPAAGGRQQQRLHVIFHVEPIAHIRAIAIEGDRLTGHRLEDHHRNQLLGELPGAVVVGAVGEHHRQAIGVMPGVHQVIAGRLAGGVGATRVVGRGFREAARWAQRAEHLIGGDVVEAKVFGALGWQRLPVGAHRLQ